MFAPVQAGPVFLGLLIFLLSSHIHMVKLKDRPIAHAQQFRKMVIFGAVILMAAAVLHP